MTVEKTHVVVTRYLPAGKPPLVHAYGPMTHARAKAIRDESLAEHADKVAGGTFSVSVNKMLDIDKRNQSPKTVKKSLGLLALERFVDTTLAGVGDGVTLSQAASLVDDLTERAICDLGGTGREGMKLLVRLALAAREWQNAAESYGSAAALGTCIDELHEWERSL
jgi:hypothetical protein